MNLASAARRLRIHSINIRDYRPRERQFGEVSYFEVLSRTSITQRLTASLNWVAIASSRESPDEHADINGTARDVSWAASALRFLNRAAINASV
jgi:hypothetical protein